MVAMLYIKFTLMLRTIQLLRPASGGPVGGLMIAVSAIALVFQAIVIGYILFRIVNTIRSKFGNAKEEEGEEDGHEEGPAANSTADPSIQDNRCGDIEDADDRVADEEDDPIRIAAVNPLGLGLSERDTDADAAESDDVEHSDQPDGTAGVAPSSLSNQASPDHRDPSTSDPVGDEKPLRESAIELAGSALEPQSPEKANGDGSTSAADEAAETS